MSKQPEALRLANSMALIGASMDGDADRAAAELRRLHALNEQLVQALESGLSGWTRVYPLMHVDSRFEDVEFREMQAVRAALAAAKGAA